MKQLLLVGALGALLMVGGCSASGAFPQPGEASTSETTVDEKALLAAEAGFAGVVAAIEAAVDNGIITAGSPTALTVAHDLAVAKTALDGARAAYRIGDARTMVGRVAAATDAIGAAWAIIPKKGAV